jgi:hypothetical protein
MKFSIRDLLWLTVVVALGLGWWVDHRQIVRESIYDRERDEREIDAANRLFLEKRGGSLPKSSAPVRVFKPTREGPQTLEWYPPTTF